MAGMAPSMRHTGAEPLGEWQARARAKLAELVGLSRFTPCAEDLDIEFTARHEAFTETRFTIQTEAGYRVPCHLCVPAGATKPLPVVICLQGHSRGMHKSMGRVLSADDPFTGGDRDFAVRAVKEGYCALALEQRCFGECGGDVKTREPRCHDATMAALLIGRTAIAERVWDVQRAIDALRHFPMADLRRIVCMGNSGGGTTTLYAACLEPRIAFAMPSCFFCTYEDSHGAVSGHCVCNFIPHVREFFEMGDVAGLIAPRPLVIVAGMEDPIFPLFAVRKAFETTQAYYAAAGAPDNIALVIGTEGHRFYADLAWPVMNRYVATSP